MKKLLGLAALTLLASCSFAPITIPVRDVELPGNSSGGTVCYVPVSEQAPARFRNATYRAKATYESNALLESNPVTVRVYGRTTPPEDPCVSITENDLVLSEPLTLEPGETQEIEVGGPAYGGELAALIVEPSYWLGASLEGGAFLSLEERIRLEDGVISVFF